MLATTSSTPGTSATAEPRDSRRRLLRGLAVVLAVSMGLPLVNATGANASDEWDEIRSSLLEVGVASSAIEPLIDKLASGEGLDSFGGVDPIESTAFQRDGFDVIQYTYPDGSVALHRSEIAVEAKSAGTARAISGCSVTGPSFVRTYSNCTIDAWVGVFIFAFRADYQIQENSADQILDSYSPSVTCASVLAACSSAADTINRAVENVAAGLPAEAEMTFAGSFASVSSTGHLFLRVGGNAASQEHRV